MDFTVLSMPSSWCVMWGPLVQREVKSPSLMVWMADEALARLLMVFPNIIAACMLERNAAMILYGSVVFNPTGQMDSAFKFMRERLRCTRNKRRPPVFAHVLY